MIERERKRERGKWKGHKESKSERETETARQTEGRGRGLEGEEKKRMIFTVVLEACQAQSSFGSLGQMRPTRFSDHRGKNENRPKQQLM